MHRLIIKLDATRLDNPDLDIRYKLPDLLIERSHGLIQDDGYVYGTNTLWLLLYLRTTDVDAAMRHIVDVVDNIRLFENDLRPATTVALETTDGDRILYPPNSTGVFTR